MNYRTQLFAAGVVSLAAAKDKGEATEAPAVQVADATMAEPPEGVRQRRGIMPKHFLPAEGIDWINKNVVAGGKGTQATLGRVFGVCTGYEERTNTLPDGKEAKSIALQGAFQTESYMTGELTEGTLAFLPAAYSEKLKAIFDANAIYEGDKLVGNNVRMVEVDCDVGVEATGKPIPYEWVITAFREGEEMAVLRKMRASRQRPAFVLKTPQAQIEAAPRPANRPLPMLTASEAQEAAVGALEGSAVVVEPTET